MQLANLSPLYTFTSSTLMEAIDSGISESARKMEEPLQKALLATDPLLLERVASASDSKAMEDGLMAGVPAQSVEECRKGLTVIREGAARCARCVLVVHAYMQCMQTSKRLYLCCPKAVACMCPGASIWPNEVCACACA